MIIIVVNVDSSIPLSVWLAQWVFQSGEKKVCEIVFHM